jgi:hypothetical protein
MDRAGTVHWQARDIQLGFTLANENVGKSKDAGQLPECSDV